MNFKLKLKSNRKGAEYLGDAHWTLQGGEGRTKPVLGI